MTGVAPRRIGAGLAWAATVAAFAGAGESQAASAWDLSSTVGLQEVWAENTTYSTTADSSDAISSLRLNARALYTGQTTRFEGFVQPVADWYRDRSHLNRVQFQAGASMAWDLTGRDNLTFREEFAYVPEFGVSTTSYSSPLVISSLSDRSSNVTSAAWRHEFSRKTDITVDARYQIYAFSNPAMIDTAGVWLSARASRDFGRSAELEFGVARGKNRFDTTRTRLQLGCAGERPVEPCPPDPDLVAKQTNGDALTSTLFAGWRGIWGTRWNATVRAGSNLVDPGVPGAPERRSAFGQASLTFRGRFVEANAGYNRDISFGTGIYAASPSQTFYGGTRIFLGRDVTLNLAVNSNHSGGLYTSRSRGIDTHSGVAQVVWRFQRYLSAYALFSRQIQDSIRARAPDVGFNRYSIGLSVEFT